jgi:hypothetical protein
MLGASLIELLPGAPGGPLHMHYGVEEMFFVLSGTADGSNAGGRGAALARRRRLLPRRPRRLARLLERDY